MFLIYYLQIVLSVLAPWLHEEIKLMTNIYKDYYKDVGVHKIFINKQHLWKFISIIVNIKFNINRLWHQYMIK